MSRIERETYPFCLISIIKLGQRLLNNCVFSLQKPLFLYTLFAALFICNTNLILHGNNAWMCVYRVPNWEMWTNVETDISDQGYITS